ncbi:hypothetical protein EJ06DRAFT_529485 [Trichodelitschia bisporula]|uniref:TPR domain-containing protein n=1 Tax=Trichodelitschia bisporula TaxID=703511 RepID=A0A6G1HZJ0_9PEZI|nr:hypothetical protein EJ06DRAFT_529485 [Trichodelitschia bisporula]
MGKTRPPERSKLAKRKKKSTNGPNNSQSPEELLAQATALLQISEPESALSTARSALAQLQLRAASNSNRIALLPALSLIGEINVELGDIESAREAFALSADIDTNGDAPESQGGGAEKFLWLAQLSEEGGRDSVNWYERGVETLKRQLHALAEQDLEEEADAIVEDKRTKLANALCSIAEVYMTDLSWDDKVAEEQCNKVIEEALVFGPDMPEVLQTAASVRISQVKLEEARHYLQQSLELWKDLEPHDPQVPDFPARISLSRLLMEAGMEDEAIEVLARLVAEDDQSVEAWYLGGWCLNLMASKQGTGSTEEDPKEFQKRSRKWLQKCLKLYQLLDYEDERLREHALELTAGLNDILGEPIDEEDDDDEADEAWQDDESENEEMEGT